MMSNFRAVMVSDANAASTPEEHRRSLNAFYITSGDVMDTDQIIHILRNQ
jgi:ureidoacrylate peracid hydrolase